MTAEALELEPEHTGISAAFLRNHHGKICIAFADPVYIRADAIVFNRTDSAVHVIMHDDMFFVSHISEAMSRAMEENDEALLTAIKGDGSVYETFVPVQRS